MNRATYLLLCTVLLALLAGCEQDPEPLMVPDQYDGSNFAANAATELAVLEQLSTLTGTIKAGRDASVTVSATQATVEFNAGNPSLATLATPYYSGLVSGWLPEVEAASGKTFTFTEAPSGTGGVAGGYLFDENGLELEQMVEKGLFGAALYNHAITLMSGDIDETTADRLVAIFGAQPEFVNSDNGDLHSNADAFMAKYAARRDPADGTGLYTSIRDAFIRLQAAAAAGPDYQSDVDAALADIQELWEKANAATVINYLTTTITRLSAANPSEDEIGGAMHAYSEAVGFLHGWRTLNTDYRLITDGQIDQLLVLMNAPAGETPTSYLLVTDSFNELGDLQTAIDELQSIYGFTDAEVASFALNQVNAQGR